MKQRAHFTKFIQLWGVVLIVGIVVTITAIDLFDHYHDFRLNFDQMRTDHIARQKKIIRQEVKRVVDLISYEKKQSEKLVRNKIKSRVYEAYAIAQHVYSQNKSTKSKAEIQQMIIDALRPIRFEQGIGYYFISRLDGMAILFPSNPDLEGENLLNVQDTHGQYIAKDLIKIIEQADDGFYEYHWTKPDVEGDDFKKISFIKRLGVFDWFIGTGLYVDDVDDQIKDNLLSTISRIRFGKEGYVFINRLNGDALVSNGKRFSGKQKLWEVFNKNPEKMRGIFKKEYIAALNPDGDYIYYSHIKLTTPDVESPKTSFIYGIPEWQWLVGAGVYLDDIEKNIALIQAELNKEIKGKILSALLIALAIVTLFLFLFRNFNRRLENDINTFTSFFNQAAVSDAVIDRNMIQFAELDRIAENANKMFAERNQAEEQRLQVLQEINSIMETVPDLIYMLDLNGKLINWNKAVEEKTGYTEDELKDKIGLELIHPDDRESAADVIRETYQKEYATRELRLFVKGGEPFPHFFSAKVKRDDNEKVMGLVVAAKDVTDLKQLEDQLRQAQKMEAIGLMAGGVAHDLNNILSGIVGYPELMLKTLASNSELRKPLMDIQESGNRAAAVVADLLTVARGVASSKEPYNLNLLIEEYLASPECKKLKSLHPKVKYQLQLDASQAYILCSSVHIKKSLMNLTTNAAEAIAGVGDITISTLNRHIDVVAGAEHNMEEGDYVVLSIHDTGPGISKKDLSHIFEPFYSKKIMARSGTGLGLTVVWNTVQEHGGKLLVESSDKGTCFQLYFPVSKEQGSGKNVNEVTENHAGNGEHILVVDDEPQLRDIASQLLRSLGYKVDSVSSGELAIKFIMEKSVDLIVLDMLMEPGMSGSQAYEEIIKLYPEQKAIVVSGFSESDDVKATIKLGAGGFIKKPYSMDQLGRAVKEALQS